MALTVPDVGEVLTLSYIVNKATPSNVKLHLFSNNATISDSTVLGDLTECAISGYSAITLTGSSWTVATNTGTTSATYAQQTFTLTGSGNVYGYYVTDNAGTGLLWVEKFTDAPHTFPSGGGTEKITPYIELA